MVNGISAFLPGSLVDSRPTKDLTPYENKTLEFKVIKLDRKRNNVVLSRRAVVEASMGEERAKLMETLREGAIVSGVVKNITEYGAFVDLGGIDGLLHITDMAWRRVRHPSEVVTAGQEITAKVLKFDTDKQRVIPGPQANGRRSVDGRGPPLPVGHPHVRQGHQHRRLRRVSSSWNPASKVWCTCPKWTGPTRTWPRTSSCPWATRSKSWCWRSTKTSVASSLGMKQCKANPWQEFAQNTKRGDRVKGPIKSITDFGVFVGLAAGIDGLVHLSDLSWNEAGEAAVRNYKKGQEVGSPGAGRGRGARAHQPGHQAARQRPVHHLRVDQRQGPDRHRQGQDRGCPGR